MVAEPTDYTGLGILIAAIGSSIASVIAAAAGLVAARRTRRVEHEVRTMNELSLGQLGEAQETRRVEAIEPQDRTARETRHLEHD